MRKTILALAAVAALSLGACAVPQSGLDTVQSAPVVTPIPGATQVCAAIHSDKFDLALKSYGAATDAVNLLIDTKVLKPGTPKAIAVANANDKVLAAFSLAEKARKLCDATSYGAALGLVNSGISEVRAALRK